MAEYTVEHLEHDLTTVMHTVDPENLSFELNDEGVSTINYELSLSAKTTTGASIFASDDVIGAKRTGWRLKYGSTLICSGYHSAVEMGTDQQHVDVAGQDFTGYLDGRYYPFRTWSIDHVNDFIIGTPPQGLAYEVSNTAVNTIIQNLWDMIFSRNGSMPLTFINDVIGLSIRYFRVDLSSTTTLLGYLQELRKTDPGFTWYWNYATRDLIIKKYARYGNPDTLVAAGNTGGNLAHVIDNKDEFLSLRFRNEGPKSTHIMGQGAGLAWQWVVALGLDANQDEFWRWDTAENFDETYTETHLDDQTRRQFAIDANPQHQITLIIDPSQITNFWTKFKPGVAIWIDYDLEAHEIHSAQHVSKMSCTVTNEGTAAVTFGLDQLYDTSGTPGVYEG